MPDGLTHVAAGYIAGERLQGGGLALFLLGCLLPDLLLRGGSLLLHGSAQRDFLELYLTPLHTPLTVLVLCVGLAQLFVVERRKAAFRALYAGCLLHFVLDFFQRTISGAGPTWETFEGYHWLYPLSWWDGQVGLYWPEQTPYALFVLLPCAGLMWLRRRLAAGRNRSGSALSQA